MISDRHHHGQGMHPGRGRQGIAPARASDPSQANDQVAQEGGGDRGEQRVGGDGDDERRKQRLVDDLQDRPARRARASPRPVGCESSGRCRRPPAPAGAPVSRAPNRPRAMPRPNAAAAMPATSPWAICSTRQVSSPNVSSTIRRRQAGQRRAGGEPDEHPERRPRLCPRGSRTARGTAAGTTSA